MPHRNNPFPDAGFEGLGLGSSGYVCPLQVFCGALGGASWLSVLRLRGDYLAIVTLAFGEINPSCAD